MEFVFRNNILIVKDEAISSFLEAIGEDKVYYDYLVENNVSKMKFYIDFDTRTFVSSYLVEVESYLPNDSWKGLFDYPNKHTPLPI